MLKLHPDGTVKEWPERPTRDWIVTEPPSEEPNVRCECGSDAFRVCVWDYPFTGGYSRLVCVKCGASRKVMDDYA